MIIYIIIIIYYSKYRSKLAGEDQEVVCSWFGIFLAFRVNWLVLLLDSIFFVFDSIVLVIACSLDNCYVNNIFFPFQKNKI